jgi:hypothetical protein
MTIDQLGSIGEFLSALAVLVTLVYLSIQVRQLKSSMFLEGYRGMNQLHNDVLNRSGFIGGSLV